MHHPTSPSQGTGPSFAVTPGPGRSFALSEVTARPVQPRPRPLERSRFDIYRTEQVHLTSTLFGGGDWHWRLTGQSGEVLADCGGYRNHAECLAAVEGLQAEAKAASVRGGDPS